MGGLRDARAKAFSRLGRSSPDPHRPFPLRFPALPHGHRRRRQKPQPVRTSFVAPNPGFNPGAGGCVSGRYPSGRRRLARAGEKRAGSVPLALAQRRRRDRTRPDPGPGSALLRGPRINSGRGRETPKDWRANKEIKIQTELAERRGVAIRSTWLGDIRRHRCGRRSTTYWGGRGVNRFGLLSVLKIYSVELSLIVSVLYSGERNGQSPLRVVVSGTR